MNKLCNCCKQVKSIDEFYRTKNGKYIDWICKVCSRKKSSEWVKNNRDKHNERSKLFYANNKELHKKYCKLWQQRNHDKVIDIVRQWRINNPIKFRVQVLTSRAVRSGKIVKSPCVICNNPSVQAHHQDYSKPYDITWMCRTCHAKLHRGKIKLERK